MIAYATAAVARIRASTHCLKVTVLCSSRVGVGIHNYACANDSPTLGTMFLDLLLPPQHSCALLTILLVQTQSPNHVCV